MKVWKLLNDGNINGPQVMSAARAQAGSGAVDVDISDANPGGLIYCWIHITGVAGATPGIVTSIVGYNVSYSRTLSQVPIAELIDSDRTVAGWYLIGTIPADKYQTLLATWALDAGTTSVTADIFITYSTRNDYNAPIN